jgi:hypothetical protein
MPNWVAERGSSSITAVDFDGREPRIYVRLKAEMRAKVRRLLAKYDYQPDLEEKAVELVLQQAELFTANGKEES